MTDLPPGKRGSLHRGSGVGAYNASCTSCHFTFVGCGEVGLSAIAAFCGVVARFLAVTVYQAFEAFGVPFLVSGLFKVVATVTQGDCFDAYVFDISGESNDDAAPSTLPELFGPVQSILELGHCEVRYLVSCLGNEGA